MFAPLPLPARFRRAFPCGFPVRPGQARAEAQDAVTMVPAAGAALRARYQALRRLPVTILAGREDRTVDVDSHARWFHGAVPHSELRLVPGAGHMFHRAVPDQVAAAIAAVAAGRRLSGGSDPAGWRLAVGHVDRPAA
jgi:pimeloyl-ACP methyl ester carboxylesterase